MSRLRLGPQVRGGICLAGRRSAECPRCEQPHAMDVRSRHRLAGPRDGDLLFACVAPGDSRRGCSSDANRRGPDAPRRGVFPCRGGSSRPTGHSRRGGRGSRNARACFSRRASPTSSLAHAHGELEALKGKSDEIRSIWTTYIPNRQTVYVYEVSPCLCSGAGFMRGWAAGRT